MRLPSQVGETTRADKHHIVTITDRYFLSMIVFDHGSLIVVSICWQRVTSRRSDFADNLLEWVVERLL